MNVNETLLSLLSCALNGTAPCEEWLQGLDLEELYKRAKAHSVAAMVAMVLEKTETFVTQSPEMKKVWLDRKNKAIRKNLLFNAERQKLLNEFEQQQIWYVPLKGTILQDYYPQMGMREMADNDIWVDPTAQEQIRSLFVAQGYEVESYGKTHHDVYLKAPFYNFELHVELFSDITSEQMATYYQAMMDKRVKDNGNRYGYHFKDEDFYVYILAHAYKHYSGSGTGLRTLTDIYVLNQKLGATLDWGYVNRELSALGILTYEQESRRLAKRVFGGEERFTMERLTEEEQAMLCYYLGASTYGNVNLCIKNRLHKLQSDSREISRLTKVKYLFQRFFPSLTMCKSYYPVVYRYPILLPFFWVWRILFKGIRNRKKLQKEWTVIQRTK